MASWRVKKTTAYCYYHSLWVLIFATFLVGCASSRQASFGSDSGDTIGMEDLDSGSQAAGEAYVVDAMRIRRPMPGHKDWRPVEFYYKRCSQIDETPPYTKTAYECTGPF